MRRASITICAALVLCGTGCEPWKILFVPPEIPDYVDPNPMPDMMQEPDPDPIVLVVEPDTPTNISEDGTPHTFLIKLSAKPPGTIVVPISLSEDGEATLSTTSLMFNDLTWATPQKVEVTGVDDQEKDGDQEIFLTIGPGLSQGTKIEGLDPITVRLNIIDGVCGNGVVDGTEVCEPGGEDPPCEYGMETCEPTCTPTCEHQERLSPGYCGDGVLQPEEEECEGAYAEAPACTDLNLGYGTYTCNVETCKRDVSTCRTVKKIVAGHKHTCALFEDGDVKCWGWNFYAQLGNADAFIWEDPDQNIYKWFTSETNKPITPRDLPSSKDIWSGWSNTCALTMDNESFCWGYNEYGELGTGKKANYEDPGFGPIPRYGEQFPVKMSWDTTNKDVSLAMNRYRSCGLLGTQSPPHTSDIYCWGTNSFYLGLEPPTSITVPPKRIHTGTSAVQLSVGHAFTCALFENGEVKCWGYNEKGELGNLTPEPQNAPILVQGLPPSTNISSGNTSTCALTKESEVWCWGKILNAPNTVIDTTPHKKMFGLPPMPTPKQISVGDHHVCVLMEDQTTRCWGANQSGQLGNGRILENYGVPEPVRDASGELLDKLIAVESGGEHTCALREDRTVWCWGANDKMQLNTMDPEPRLHPARIEGL